MENLLTIKEISEKFQELSEKEVSVGGWLRGVRNGKQNSFATLNDGSSMQNLQIFFANEFPEREKLAFLKIGSALRILGVLKVTPNREQPFELIAQRIIDFSTTSENYPIQKKNLPIEFVRDYPQFRTRTRYFLAAFRIRSSVSYLIHEFFRKENFVYIATPIITSNDAEGGGESFSITQNSRDNEFFREKASLTVSGQLHAEALTQGLGKVYNFSPCFRAENSNTTKHLAEFWMIEAEMSFCDLDELMDTIEKMIKHIVGGILQAHPKEIEFFEEIKGGQISKLQSLLDENFERVSYTDCVEIIARRIREEQDFFSSREISWGDDLSSEHEKFIAAYFNKPVFIRDYPVELKAFYMKRNREGKTVSCVDLLFPSVGEVVGGSAREENYDKLVNRADAQHLDVKKLEWYLDLRKNGYSPSAGFGLGLERLLMFLTGSENVRDTIAFPRAPGELKF